MHGHVASFPGDFCDRGARITLFGSLVPLPDRSLGGYSAARYCSRIAATGTATGGPTREVPMTTVAQLDITLRCAAALDWERSSSNVIAAATPPARCGTPASDNPISTPVSAPNSVSSLHSPR